MKCQEFRIHSSLSTKAVRGLEVITFYKIGLIGGVGRETEKSLAVKAIAAPGLAPKEK